MQETIKIVTNKATYRVLSVEQNETEDYIATIQCIKKTLTFKMKPEEILADDDMTDRFSPRDVRALTYLGYLGINSPKYRILAKQLSQNDQLLFVVHKKGEKNAAYKTAKDISSDKEMLKNLDQQDAHMVGYLSASESIEKEQEQKIKAQLIEEVKENDNEK